MKKSSTPSDVREVIVGQPPELLPFMPPLMLCFLYMMLSNSGIVGPFKNGFYANDETISHPLGNDTVPYSLVIVVAFVIAPICIIAGNFQECRRQTFSEVFIYCFGLVMGMTLTAIIKLCAGRLRPDFIERCQPDYSLTATPDGFITEDVCTGDEDEILEGRKSHPSGHSATSAFSGVYIVIMWLRVAERHGVHRATSTLVMAVIVMYPVFVAISRVTDYKHHPHDVIVGSLLGVLFALYTAFYLNEWVDVRRSLIKNSTKAAIIPCKEEIPLEEKEDNGGAGFSSVHQRKSASF